MRFALTPVLYFLLGVSSISAVEPSWKKLIRPQSAGNFPEIPPFHAEYEFGWTNIPAARAWATFQYLDKRYYFSANGATYGWVRNLWQIDAAQTASGIRAGWFPEKMNQVEHYRTYKMIMDVSYNRTQADRLRMAIPAPGKPPSRKVFPIENMRDMVAAMLFVRSQPLNNGDEISQVVFPGDSAFLVQSRVLGREMINCEGKPIRAIKFGLGLRKILMEGPQKGKLVPHRKFHSGIIWISDDDKRLPIRAEMNIFIGYVYAQLRTVQFSSFYNTRQGLQER
jgi:hypothetical protein